MPQLPLSSSSFEAILPANGRAPAWPAWQEAVDEGADAGRCGEALTIVAPVVPEKLDALRALLEEMGKDAARNGVVGFARSRRTHFARWVVLDTPGAAPLLVFESNHDGSPDAYLDELLEVGGPGLASIYAHCEHGGTPDLKGFLLARRVGYEAFYRGYPARSVGQVRTALEIRRRVLDYVGRARGELAKLPAKVAHRRIREALRREGAPRPRYARVPHVPLEFFTEGLQAAVGPVGAARTRATAMLLGIVSLPLIAFAAADLIFGWYGLSVLALAAVAYALGLLGLAAAIRLVETRATPGEPPSPLTDPHVLAAEEDIAVQNQLTHVATIKPGILRSLLVRGVLRGINLLARVTFTRGNLGGIPSIHFARWVILPDRRLLFLSNFDGSWDSYLGDFIDRASGGLSGIWSNTEWFPTTVLLFWMGARDADAFKQWTRDRQIPTQVWYTAYPLYSVQNLRDAIAMAETMDEDLTEDGAARWLAALS